MKRYKLITIIAVCLLLTSITVVFAAFIFNQTVTTTSKLGNITISDKTFYSYQDSTYKDMRYDTVLVLDDIAFITSDSYNKATTKGSTFQSGIDYYVVGTYDKAMIIYGDPIPSGTNYYVDIDGGFSITSDTTFLAGTTYYEKTSNTGYTRTQTITVGASVSNAYYVKDISYTGILSVGSCIKKDGTTATATVGADNKTINIESLDLTITCTLDSKNGIGSATTNNEDYYAVISPTFYGITILDSTVTTKDVINTTSVICSATKDKEDNNYKYLNQLGFGFSFKNEIAVFVRIHIQDAWVSVKEYASNKKEVYSLKDQVAGVSPFHIADSDWYFNAEDNTAYLKTIVNVEYDEDGKIKAHSFVFQVNQAYYYIPSKTTIYREYINVDVAFTVDVIQANRAKEVWGINPLDLS